MTLPPIANGTERGICAASPRKIHGYSHARPAASSQPAALLANRFHACPDEGCIADTLAHSARRFNALRVGEGELACSDQVLF